MFSACPSYVFQSPSVRVSVLQAGVLVVWKADVRGRLQAVPISKHDLQEQLTDVVLKPASPIDPSTLVGSMVASYCNWLQQR